MSSADGRSAHFRDGRFFNPGGARPRGSVQLLKWLLQRKTGPWQNSYRLIGEPAPPPRVDGGELRVTFVNHATVLIQTQGCNILTDPIWSERASPVSFLGPRRHRAPGVPFEDLPPVDSVWISHNHYDHFDVPTLRRLAQRDAPAVFCPLGLMQPLREAGFRHIHELDWWQNRDWKNMRIHCVPAQHFSSRTPFDGNRTLWCGWILQAPGGDVYFAGDTGFGDHFRAIREKFSTVRLALLPIGAFKPEWFMGPVHMSPDQAVQAHEILGAAASIAIHFGTFRLGDEGQNEPSDRLNLVLRQTRRQDFFWVLGEGESRSIPAAPFPSAGNG